MKSKHIGPYTYCYLCERLRICFRSYIINDDWAWLCVDCGKK